MNQTKLSNIKSLLLHNHPLAFNYALHDYLDEGFELHVDKSKGYHLDNPRSCHLIFEELSLVVFLKANTFFGTKLTIVEDPQGVLRDQEVGRSPHLYDSTSPLNPNLNKELDSH